MLLDKLSSNLKPDGANGVYYLVQDTLYDAAGRVEQRDLGAVYTGDNPVLVSDYAYYPWNVDNGRISSIKAGTYATPTSLLDLRYDYDNRGNITSILDVKNSSQKQCFGYDGLSRLISAAVGTNDATCSGMVGLGEYANEAYTYNATTGNLHSKTGLGTYNYDTTQPHAVDSVTGWTYTYDPNGNMTRRDPTGTDVYDYVYDAENRMVQAKKNGAEIASFTYDGDCNRVKVVMGTTTTAFVGGYYEVTGNLITKYYNAGGTRIAMRVGTNNFYWLVGDHLGSTSIVASAMGMLQDRILYKAWGEVRYPSGPVGTRYTYTGQYAYNTSGANDFGLMYYGARFYDPYLNRWLQPDSIIPSENGIYTPLTVDYHETQFLLQLNQENQQRLYDSDKKPPSVPTNPLSFDRYSYCFNNPVRYTDPTGHCPLCLLLGLTPAELLLLGVAVVGTYLYYTVPGVREGVTQGLQDAGEGLSAVFARGDGGASQAAQHLSMLSGGSDVAGFGSHPGLPDPNGDDRKHNVEGLRNTLQSIKNNMRTGETLEHYLYRQGWTERQILDFTSTLSDYIDYNLSTDVEYFGVTQEIADELTALANFFGVY
jgi:RHS repeat-associated protein